MENGLTLDAICEPSDDVVARDIEGELIIIPLTANVGDIEDAIFTLNKTGRAVWDRLDGKRTLRTVAAELAEGYSAPRSAIEADVLGLLHELVQRQIVSVQ